MFKRYGRFTVGYLAASVLALPVWAQSLAPMVFNYTLTSQPGDIVALQGARFGSAPTAWLHAPDGSPVVQLDIVSHPSTDALTVRLPSSLPSAVGAAMLVAVHNGTTVGNIVGLNAARAYGLDGIEVVPGARFRIIGRNLRATGYTPLVRVGGITASVDLAASDDNLLTVTAPTGLSATSHVEITVDNGNGTGPSTLDRPIAVNAIAAADPFGTGIGWTSVFAPSAAQVINAATDSRLGSNVAKCDGQSGTDDYSGIWNAITYVYFTLHGGTVQLPAGNCHISSSLQMLNGVILQGAVNTDGSPATTLTFDSDLAVYAGNPGDHNIAVRNLIFAPTNGGNNANAAIYFNNLHHVVIQNVRVLSPQHYSLQLGNTANMAVIDTDLQGAMSASTLHGFALSGNRVQFQTPGSIGMMLDGAAEGVVLNNHLTRIYQRVRRLPGDVIHVSTVNFASRMLMQGNVFDVDGDPIEYYWNDGETILNEGGGPCQTSNPGTVTSATASTLTDTGHVIDFHCIGMNAADELPLHRVQVAQIVAGTGVGQTRYITGYDSSSHTLSVDQPWDVVPDSSSRYVASVMGMEKFIIKGNTASDNPRGIGLVSGSMREIDVIDNILHNNQGILIESAASLVDPSHPLFSFVSSINISRNVLDNPRDPYPSNIFIEQMQWAQASAFGTGLVDIVVRDNQVTAHVPNLRASNFPEGYSSRMLVAQTLTDNGIPQILGTVFQRNICTHCETAYYLSSGNFGAVVDSPTNILSGNLIQRFSLAVAADHVAQLDAGTVYGSVPSSTLLSVSKLTIDQGQMLSLVAQVSGAHPGGSVQFMDGGTVLGTGVLDASGQALLDTAALTSAGTHAITVVYAGDSGNLASTSAAATVVVSANTAAQGAVAPVVFNRTLTVHPGDVFTLQGQRLGSAPQVWLSAAGGQPDRPLAIVNTGEVANGIVSVRLPADAAYPMVVRVFNGTAWSMSLVLNQARVDNLDALELVPGGRLRVMGRNLMTPGYTPQVLVGGLAAYVDVGHSNENLLVVTAPTALMGAAQTQVSVDNGNGSGATVLDRVLAVNNIPAADPFGLGIGWTAVYAPLMQQVLDPTVDANDFRMLVDGRVSSQMALCKGDSSYDDLGAINFGIYYLNQTGGGVLQLPPGTCHISSGIQLQANVILQGSDDSTHPTIIQYDQTAAYAANGLSGNVAVRNITFRPGASASGPVFNVQNENRVVFQNVNVTTQRKGAYQAIYNNTNVVISGCSFAGPNSFANAGFAIENNAFNYQADSGLNLNRARDGLFKGNTITRTVTSSLTSVQARALSVSLTSRVQVISNQIQAIGSQLGSDTGLAALFAVDSKGLTTGTVQSASPLSMTDTRNTFTAKPFGNDTNSDGKTGVPEGYTLAIVSGTGAGQLRHIRAVDTSAHSLYIDQGWDVLPDATSHYSVLVIGMERSRIQGNSIDGFPGGIYLSNAGLNEVDLLGNRLTNTGGIFVNSTDDSANHYFGPVYSLTIDGNVLSSPDRSYRQALNVSHTQIGTSSQPFGMALTNVLVRNNQLINAQPDVSLGRTGGYSMLGYLVSAVPGVPSVLGPVFQANGCQGCSVAYTMSAPVRGATIYTPVTTTPPPTQLIAHQTNSAAPAGAQTDVNTVVNP